jgi:signal transduction histidine kinase
MSHMIFDPPPRRRGRSLLWMLFPSVVVVVAWGFVVAEILGRNAETRGLPIIERLNPIRLVMEIGERLPIIMVFIGLMMIAIYATLHVGLRPLRRLSLLAAEIGPATIDARLPVASTPRELAPLVEAFNATLDRLEAGWRAQRDFSANAAHELRTPLATLRAQVESLLEPDERRAASEEFERLGRLVAQLLALAEADGGALGQASRFDLVALARDVASDMAGFVLSSERTLGFDSAPEIFMIEGQADLVETALRNLLENAVRHTPSGVEIMVTLDADGVVRVRDDGPGVPDAVKDRLFERFSRGDPQGPGAGLGLSIVRQIMEHHGGTVRLASLSPGACFELDFRRRA